MPQAESETPIREPRISKSGDLLIEVRPDGDVIRGHLLDVSLHGFAVRHECQQFVPGEQVRVVYDWGKVPARVVWVGNRGGVMAAGFQMD